MYSHLAIRPQILLLSSESISTMLWERSGLAVARGLRAILLKLLGHPTFRIDQSATATMAVACCCRKNMTMWNACTLKTEAQTYNNTSHLEVPWQTCVFARITFPCNSSGFYRFLNTARVLGNIFRIDLTMDESLPNFSHTSTSRFMISSISISWFLDFPFAIACIHDVSNRKTAPL